MRCPRYGEPPYWAVIFASVRDERDGDGYADVAQRMEQLAATQPGYLGLEAARDADGRARWYRDYTLRIACVEEAYDFDG